MVLDVQHNTEETRFEVIQGETTACLIYRLHGKAFMIMHTEVPKVMGGQRVGRYLIVAALDFAKSNHYNVLFVYCPFVKSYLKRHPELKEGVKVIMAK
ncbi:MAG: GNAT family N-acetyltransferase [Bacteroidota bacterium]